MTLSIADRINLTPLLPEAGSIVDIMLIKGMKNKIIFTAEFIEANGIETTREGNKVFTTWKNECDIDIAFTPQENKILVDAITQADANKQITEYNVDLCAKILGRL